MMKWINVISRSLFAICIITAITLLFSGQQTIQARYDILRTDFDSHWHYIPTTVNDFTFGKARIFGDETIPYHLTPKRQKKEEINYYWSYCYYGGK